MMDQKSRFQSLILYALEHDMLDTAEFTAERLLSYEQNDIFLSSLNPSMTQQKTYKSKSLGSNSKERQFTLPSASLESIYLYAYVLYRRRRYKAAYNVTADYCGQHVGCSYIFSKSCLQLNRESDGIRSLLATMSMWENTNNSSSFSSGINPDNIACFMLLGKLYSKIGDIPRSTINFSKVLEINPFIWEALEELSRMGVKINVDSIYNSKDEDAFTNQIDEKTGLENNNTSDMDNGTSTNISSNKNHIFKTPITKKKTTLLTTSSPENTFITPINKAGKNNGSSKRGSNITSRLIHNNTSLNNQKDLDDDVGLKKYILGSSFNNDVFKSSSKNPKYTRNKFVLNETPTLFDNIGENLTLENSNSYIVSIYAKLAKGLQASTAYDCFKAIRIFDSLPDYERYTPWVISKLGRLHFEIVNYEEAELYYQKLRLIDRTRLQDMEYYSTLLWHLHKEVELSFLAHELYEVEANSEITWISIGNLFSFRKETEDAIKCFGKAIVINPRCSYAYTLQGHEYLATDAFENAMSCFRHSTLIDKRHYNAFYGIGMIYLKLGDFRKAEFHFRKAIEINPVNVILICCVGMVLEKLDKREESLKQYEFAVKLQPLSMLALFKKAQVLYSMGEFDEALRDFQKLENLAPDEASVHFILGKLYKHFGRKYEAIRQFTISLNLDPKGSHLIKESLESLNED